MGDILVLSPKLADGTELALGSFAILADDLSFSLPSDAPDPPAFAGGFFFGLLAATFRCVPDGTRFVMVFQNRLRLDF